MHSIVRQERFFVDPIEVALALLGFHCAANFEKVSEHGFLAFGAQAGRFVKSLLEVGCHFAIFGEQLAHTLILFVDAEAHLLTMRHITRVQFGDFLEFLRAEIELALEPGELGLGACEHLAMSGGGVRV